MSEVNSYTTSSKGRLSGSTRSVANDLFCPVVKLCLEFMRSGYRAICFFMPCGRYRFLWIDIIGDGELTRSLFILAYAILSLDFLTVNLDGL